MIEYVDSFLLLTLLGTIYYIYYKHKIFFRAINIVMDSTILSHFNNSENRVIKSKRGRKKKMLPKINEEEGNDIIEKRQTNYMCSIW